MNRIKITLSIILSLTLMLFVACEDRSDLNAPQAPNTGEADFSSFVTIGNSLTSAYQNGSLYESSQMYSFGKLIADQVGTEYTQPYISEPGIPGKLEIVSLSPDIVFAPNSGTGENKNLDQQKPYNNLGVPGAILYDLIDETDFAQKLAERGNPFFNLILRDQQLGRNQIEQALSLEPTFITLWIGNNDVLGYAASGGTSGTDAATQSLPTDIPTFTYLYNVVADAITDTSGYRKIAVANIPDVQIIPYFTTVGPKMAVGIQGLMSVDPRVQGLVFQRNGETVGTGLVTPDNLATGKVLITLTGGQITSLLGDTEGKYYASIGETPPAGIDVNMPFGFHPQNPWPDKYILDQDEIVVTQDATTAFNTVISDVVEKYDSWVLVDVNEFFNDLKAAEASTGGMIIDGIKFNTSFILGNTFSLDGVHPTTQGHGIIANEFISAINSEFSASIPRIDLSTLPSSIPLAKRNVASKSAFILKNCTWKDILL